MEQKVSRTKTEAKALAEQYMEWQPPRRKGGLSTWLASLLHRQRPDKVEEPEPIRPAFR